MSSAFAAGVGASILSVGLAALGYYGASSFPKLSSQYDQVFAKQYMNPAIAAAHGFAIGSLGYVGGTWLANMLM